MEPSDSRAAFAAPFQYRRSLPPHRGATRASQVLECLSPRMSWARDPGRLPASSHCDAFSSASAYRTASPPAYYCNGAESLQGRCAAPYDLRSSLCTLTPCCSSFLTPSQRQHSVRVVDYSLPGGVILPARGTKLRLAHTRSVWTATLINLRGRPQHQQN